MSKQYMQKIAKHKEKALFSTDFSALQIELCCERYFM